MPEERRCDLCQFGESLPCSNGDCHSGNNLKDFKPKAEEDKDNPGWSIGSITYIKEKDILIIGLNNGAGIGIIVELTPGEIANLQ